MTDTECIYRPEACGLTTVASTTSTKSSSAAKEMQFALNPEGRLKLRHLTYIRLMPAGWRSRKMATAMPAIPMCSSHCCTTAAPLVRSAIQCRSKIDHDCVDLNLNLHLTRLGHRGCVKMRLM